jgi:hypothetical protein
MTNAVTLKFLLMAEDKASKILQHTGGEVDKAGKKVGGFSTTAKVAMAGAGLAVVGFAASSISKFKQVTTESRGLQRSLGGTLEQASRLREAAVLSGVDVETFGKSMQKVDKTLVGATANQKTAAAMTKTLGFAFQDAHGHVKPMGELLPQIADKFAGMADGPEKTALAMKLFGKAGTQMLPFLSKGASGIKELEKESDKFGTTIGNKSIKDLAAAKEGQRKWQASMDGLKVTIGAQLLPMVTQFINFIRDHVIPIVQKITGFIRDHQGVMKLLGIVIGTVVVGLKIWAIVQGVLNAVMAANPIALVVIAIAGLAAGIIYAYKHSAAFRRIVADAFGAVRAAGVFLWNVMKTVFGALVQAWHFVGSIFHAVGGAIGAVFDFIGQHWGLLLAPLTGGFSILIQHWRGVRDAFVSAWHFIRDHVFGPIKTAFRAVRDVARVVTGEINTIWQGLGSGLQWAWDHTIGYVFGLIKGAIAWLKNALKWLTGGGNAPMPKAGHNGPTKGKGSGIQFGTGQTQDTAGSIYGTPHRAGGGPVIGGSPYIVGDGGRPELFIPEHSGHIEPRTDLAHRHKRHRAKNGGLGDLGDMGSLGGNTYNVRITFPPGIVLGSPMDVGKAVKKALETDLNGGGTLTVRSGAIRTRH